MPATGKIDNNGIICPVSFESQKGWYLVSILIDSFAGESVAPADAFPQYEVYATDASVNGVEYTAAGGRTP